MVEVFVTGTGATPIARHYSYGPRELAYVAGRSALEEAGVDSVDYLIVASSILYLQNPQLDLASYIASALGLHAVHAMTVEAGETSGLAALEVGASLIESHRASRVLIVGVDKLTEHSSSLTYGMLQRLYNTEAEAYYKIGHAGVAALLMRLYMKRYGVDRETLAYWPALMHSHAKLNPHAMLRFAITPEKVLRGMPIADPITLLDAFPLGDGAAAIVLEAGDEASGAPLAVVEQVESATGMPSPQLRDDPLDLESVRTVAQRLGDTSVDVMEIHDSFTIYGLLELEALGLSSPGKAAIEVAEGKYSLEGKKPLVNPSGGLKARGHPVGATGIYKIVELTRILAEKWPGAKRGDEKKALALDINAAGTTARAAILRKP